jgi:2,4-dienoyl-CoA reductase-like NADH-dependent reductase (Old Yellow Enzyme family)
MRPYAMPRPLETEEIPGIVEDFRRGAQNAKYAGFDGVMVHGGNGYLIDQFMQDRTNRRTDCYGGSLPNRVRFLLEVTDAVIGVWGPDRVGVHLRPRGQEENDMGDTDPATTFTHAARQLSDRGVAFLFFREREGADSILPGLRTTFGGVIIANEDMTALAAERLVTEGTADAVAFGRPYIANPDLAQRLVLGSPLNTPDTSTFYSGTWDDAVGYTDYPAST